MDHYTCVSGGEFLDVFRPPKPKGEGRNKEKFGAILASELHKVIVNFSAELSFIYPGKKNKCLKNVELVIILALFKVLIQLVQTQVFEKNIYNNSLIKNFIRNNMIYLKAGRMVVSQYWSTNISKGHYPE